MPKSRYTGLKAEKSRSRGTEEGVAMPKSRYTELKHFSIFAEQRLEFCSSYGYKVRLLFKLWSKKAK